MGLGSAIRRVFGKDNAGFEFPQNMALAGTGGDPQQPNSAVEEVMEMTRRIGYLTMDEQIIALCAGNKKLQPFLPIFSPLNNTIFLSKDQAMIKRIRLENFCTMMKLTMAPEDYEANGYELIEALRLHGHDRISGAVEGWIGHLCTENARKIEVTTKKA